jgi:ABC-2 type transport system ATP-binding protein
MPSASAIHLHDLTKRYGDVAVVDRLELEIPCGGLFGFLGPNGAGKSTTLKMMTGVLAPDEGDTRFGSVSMGRDPLAAKRLIGSVADNLALFEYLTIWEHLDLIRSLYDLGEQSFLLRARQLLDLLDLTADAGKPVRRVSYGMRKKTALAMALLPNPKFLILDEPFEGLDPVMAASIKLALRQATTKGTTVFLTTHMLDAVADLLTHYALLRHGVLVAQGTTEALIQANTTLTAEYLRHFDQAEAEELSWLG